MVAATYFKCMHTAQLCKGDCIILYICLVVGPLLSLLQSIWIILQICLAVVTYGSP